MMINQGDNLSRFDLKSNKTMKAGWLNYSKSESCLESLIPYTADIKQLIRVQSHNSLDLRLAALSPSCLPSQKALKTAKFGNCRNFKISVQTKKPICYTLEAFKEARLAFLCSMAFLQISAVLSFKLLGRRSSVLDKDSILFITGSLFLFSLGPVFFPFDLTSLNTFLSLAPSLDVFLTAILSSLPFSIIQISYFWLIKQICF